MWAHYRFVFPAVARHAAFDGAGECRMLSHVASFCSYVCTSASQTGFRRLSGEISPKRMRNWPVDAKSFAKRIQNGLKAAAEEHVSSKSRPIGAEILFGERKSHVSRSSCQAWRPRSYEAAKYGVLAFQGGVPIVPLRGIRPFDRRFWQR